MMLTDRQLQSLRNIGCESEEAADEIVTLRAEIETLRKDAERYRHIRKSGTWETEVGRALLSDSPEALDAAIDADMAKP